MAAILLNSGSRLHKHQLLVLAPEIKKHPTADAAIAAFRDEAQRPGSVA